LSAPLRVEVPEKLEPLLQRARYKGAHGGRGGAKSHFFAEQLILRCYAETTKAVCIREVQESIKDSVKALLEGKVQKLGLGEFFEVVRDEIRGRNGSLIIFRGMQSYNAQNIKSLEAFDIAWVEEAQALSDISLRMLRPTLRKEGSELWFSWNPRHDTDAVDAYLRGPNKPKDAIVVEVNWQDNPWFPDVLRKEMEEDIAADPEMADHVWGGNYEIVSEGAYYARLLAQADREGRIGRFPHSPNALVRTAFDIGVDDYTAVWFIQDDGFKATVIDYYEASGDGADDIIAACMPEVFLPPSHDARWDGWTREQALRDIGREHPFKYGDNFLPHDVRMREWGHGARSRVESLITYGLKSIRKGIPANPADRIQAVRRILPVVRFNNTPRVEVGLKRLRRYRRKFNDALQTYTTPEHDENSHGADAFGEYAVNCGITPPKEPQKPKPIDTRLPTLNEIVKDTFKNRKNIGNRIR
jgi:phage terminase large subunit